MTTEISVDTAPDTVRPRLIPSTRFALALLVFLAFVVQYSQRVNLPIGIVCMVNRTKSIATPSQLNFNTQTESERFYKNFEIKTTQQPISIAPIEKSGFFVDKQFEWGEFQQQLLLGSYWAGYIFTQVPGGWVATSIGFKWVYAGSLGISSLATFALTIIYKIPSDHFYIVFILRFIVGLAHGVLFPSTVALWSVWAVPQERSTLASVGFCGTHLGTSFTMLMGGLFCRYLNSGWIYIFLTTSILGFIWFILWISFTADAPHHHKSITTHERNYIINATGSTGKRRNITLSSVPWGKMIKSKPVNALILTHIGNLFGLFFFLTNLGKILKELLNVSPQNTGYILSFGFFLTLLSSLTSGITTDHLVRANVLTLTTARRIFNSLTSFVPVLCMAVLCFCDQSKQLLGIFTILIFLAISGLGYGSGYVVNFSDVVPAYSGIVFGIANTFASLAGLIGNIVAGIVVHQPILEQWRKLYIMFGIVYFLSGLVYAIYGSAEPRKWATFQAAENAAKQETQINDEEAVPMKDKI